jgi:hypothetical protein
MAKYLSPVAWTNKAGDYISICRAMSLCQTLMYECGKYQRIFRGILSVPQNILMDLNNVMCKLDLYPFYVKLVLWRPSKPVIQGLKT